MTKGGYSEPHRELTNADGRCDEPRRLLHLQQPSWSWQSWQRIDDGRASLLRQQIQPLNRRHEAGDPLQRNTKKHISPQKFSGKPEPCVTQHHQQHGNRTPPPVDVLAVCCSRWHPPCIRLHSHA